jgi:hypothetical protein
MNDIKTPVGGVRIVERMRGGYHLAGSALSGLATGILHSGEIRANILALHTQLQGDQGFTNERVVRLVSSYKVVDYIHDKLRRDLITGDELQLVDHVIVRYCELASNMATRLRLPVCIARQIDDDTISFARFHAGVFALARGDREAAGNYFSDVKKHWKIDVKELVGLVGAEKYDEVAGLLGECFGRLKLLLPATGVPVIIRGREDTVSLDTEPLFRLRQAQLLERTTQTDPGEVKPAASPDTSAPQTRPGSRSPQK